MSLDEKLAAIRERAGAATKGPWFPWDRGVGWHIALTDKLDKYGCPEGDRLLPEGHRTDIGREEDARFIAAARSDVPALLSMVDAVLALHSPPEGWEREWKDPEWALREGEVRCAGCQTHATFTPLKACRTRKAIEEASRG